MTTTSTVAWPKLQRNLVAILRGVKPTEIDGMIDVLVEAGSRPSRSRSIHPNRFSPSRKPESARRPRF